ncbi:MAG: 2-phospho-L-lactate transferase [Solirubrobacterales bacterium]|nr:2-phospho-L-lactate transferase [Solirubrobacterales bacterium]MBV8947133.1 2-phospho-L-lactate transferase [Solirubrobacterales bacterium]MBV9811043.1 2-phospho-L-lactate transferase [Solirubrobacterales bacterium]
MSGPVVVLAGGTGGAKLARGMLDVTGPESLVVVANTGDDIEIYGAYVSPDPDLVTFWLADQIDERGWGLADDSFHVMDGLRAISVDVWFNLGDQDLAIGLERARRLQAGQRLTEAHRAIARAMGAPDAVLPMSDSPVRTRVLAGGRWWPFQEYMIRAGGATGNAAVDDVDFRGARTARPTPEVLNAIATARAIVIGPSNPVISIGPILAIPGMRAALVESPAPVVAISPLVGGQVLKGPTAAFMRLTGLALSSDGIAAYYDGLIDGLVADRRTRRLPVLETDVLMDTPAARRRVAEEALGFALALR